MMTDVDHLYAHGRGGGRQAGAERASPASQILDPAVSKRREWITPGVAAAEAPWYTCVSVVCVWDECAMKPLLTFITRLYV